MTFPVASAAGVDLGEATVCLQSLGLQPNVQATTATVARCKRISRSCRFQVSAYRTTAIHLMAAIKDGWIRAR
jgi:hypothetical protein